MDVVQFSSPRLCPTLMPVSSPSDSKKPATFLYPLPQHPVHQDKIHASFVLFNLNFSCPEQINYMLYFYRNIAFPSVPTSLPLSFHFPFLLNYSRGFPPIYVTRHHEIIAKCYHCWSLHSLVTQPSLLGVCPVTISTWQLLARDSSNIAQGTASTRSAVSVLHRYKVGLKKWLDI